MCRFYTMLELGTTAAVESFLTSHGSWSQIGMSDTVADWLNWVWVSH